ncbi:antitoxin MazE-like protein [Rhodopseudomonas palustris]|uniref:antitoxin MazE-like protein n=1 Tax=Rhodopseudomonas palustris TaxID=1076 RepID=UPI0024BF360A|nr:antitoxin MazE-like protein [Rhodopseudomonas palustris]
MVRIAGPSSAEVITVGTSDDRDSEERAREAARQLRAEMTAPGLRPTDPPLPDLDAPEIKAKIRRACAAINESAEEQELLEQLGVMMIEVWGDDGK